MVIELENFNPGEFRYWWARMSPHLTIRLDILRYRLGRPIHISANPMAIGRNNGPIGMSDHNVDKWGEVRGVDVFVEGVTTKDQAMRVVRVANELGFTAIGVYPEWRNNIGENQVGFHFGYRPRCKMGDPDTWGQVGGDYVGVDLALDMIQS